MKRTIIFIIIIYAVLIGITIINAFPINISGLLLSSFSLIVLRLLKIEIKTNYLEKELEMYFYNKGYGSESGKEAEDMAAFLKTVLNERLNDLEDIAFNLRNEIFALKDSFFNNNESKLLEE